LSFFLFFVLLHDKSLDAVLLDAIALSESMLVRARDTIALSIATIAVDTLNRVVSLTAGSRMGCIQRAIN
jgi:hypothetical protein